MSQNSILLLKDIFYLESSKGHIICFYLNEQRVLQRRNLGVMPFAFVHKNFPWAYMQDGKGFLINFDNVERFEGFVVEKAKGAVNTPITASDTGLFKGYGFIGLEDFPNPISSTDKIEGGTSIVFREVPIQGHENKMRLVLATPAGIDIIEILKTRQMRSNNPNGIRMNYNPWPTVPLPGADLK